MNLLVFSLISWAAICLFSAVPKSLGLVENTILYFLLCMCTTMSSSIIALNMHLIVISQTIYMFFSYWLTRTVAYPLILMSGINLFLYFKNNWIRLLLLFLTVISALIIEKFTHSMGLLVNTGWNQYYFVLLALFLFLLNSGAAVLLRKMREKQQ